MITLRFVSVLSCIQIVAMATTDQKRSSTNGHLSSIINKREAVELVELEQDEKPAALLFSAANLTRSHHYWTRKRGRDQSTQDPDYYYYQYGYRTTKRSFSLKSTPRPKRNTLNGQESDQTSMEFQGTEATRPIQSSTKQQVAINANIDDPNTTATVRPTDEPIHIAPKPHDRHRPRQLHKRFGSKLNNCCVEETNFAGFNETLMSIRSECLMKMRKNRKANNASNDLIEGDGGLYTMFSYDRINFHKFLVVCTIGCVSQKTGMVDADDDINVQVAKMITKSNFAREEWEKAVSDNLVEKCVEEVSSSERQPVNAFGFQCSSKAAEFVYCMWRELFLTCPKDKQQKSKSCEKLRNVLSSSKVNKFKN